MIKLGYFSLIVFSSMLCMANTHAASLDKYGGRPDFQPGQQVVKSPRDIAIEKAVLAIKNAGDGSAELVEEYSRRAKAALEKGSYAEAQFYSDILRRSGH